mgnify:CR=1 FL=1
MNIQEMVEILNAVESTGLFSFVAVTTKDGLKKSRVTKEFTPARFSFVTTVCAKTVSCGNDYQAEVNNRLEKESKVPDFKAKSTYCAPIAPNRLVFKHNERDEYYLRLYPNLCKSLNTTIRRFDADGIEIGDSEWEQIQAEYFPLPSKNEHQGLDAPIIVNNYKLENVKFLKPVEILINELTDEIIKIIKKKIA